MCVKFLFSWKEHEKVKKKYSCQRRWKLSSFAFASSPSPATENEHFSVKRTAASTTATNKVKAHKKKKCAK